MPGSHGMGRSVERSSTRVRVGVAGVPAGDLRVVVEDVGDVPAEDDVAEAEAALRRPSFSLSSDTYLPRKTPSTSKPPILARGDASVFEVFQTAAAHRSWLAFLEGRELERRGFYVGTQTVLVCV